MTAHVRDEEPLINRDEAPRGARDPGTTRRLVMGCSLPPGVTEAAHYAAARTLLVSHGGNELWANK